MQRESPGPGAVQGPSSRVILFLGACPYRPQICRGFDYERQERWPNQTPTDDTFSLRTLARLSAASSLSCSCHVPGTRGWLCSRAARTRCSCVIACSPLLAVATAAVMTDILMSLPVSPSIAASLSSDTSALSGSAEGRCLRQISSRVMRSGFSKSMLSSRDSIA